MRKKAALLTFVGLVAVLALAVDEIAAENREARPGQPRRDRSAAPKAGGPDCANATAIRNSPAASVTIPSTPGAIMTPSDNSAALRRSLIS